MSIIFLGVVMSLTWKTIDRYEQCCKDETNRFTINKMRVQYELFDCLESKIIGVYSDLQKAKDKANDINKEEVDDTESYL